MPEKVTSLNGLIVTSEYCSYNFSAHNVYYVKSTTLVNSSAINMTNDVILGGAPLPAVMLFNLLRA